MSIGTLGNPVSYLKIKWLLINTFESIRAPIVNGTVGLMLVGGDKRASGLEEIMGIKDKLSVAEIKLEKGNTPSKVSFVLVLY